MAEEALELLERLSEILRTGRPANEIPEAFLSCVTGKWKQAERDILFLHDSSDGRLVAAAARGYDLARLELLRLGISEGIAGEAYHARSGAIYSTPESIAAARADLPRSQRELLASAQLSEAPPRSAVAVPLLTADGPLGALMLECLSRAEAFGEDDLRLLQHLASFAGLWLENARLRDQASGTPASREADRLKAEAISFLAHEMRTPLTSIKGYATALLLDEVTFTVDKQREFIQCIDEECDTLVDLIHDLLESSIIDAGLMVLELGPVSLSRLVQRMVRDFAGRAGKHRFHVEFPEQFPLIEADPDRLAQVLRNLLDNAIKYSPQGGLITVRGSVRPGEVMVSVADQGIGIAPEHLNRLFDKFFRIKEGANRGTVGSGLGLPIARTIVESHGGRIWAESRPGEGSAFYFTIPLGETTTEPSDA